MVAIVQIVFHNLDVFLFSSYIQDLRFYVLAGVQSWGLMDNLKKSFFYIWTETRIITDHADVLHLRIILEIRRILHRKIIIRSLNVIVERIISSRSHEQTTIILLYGIAGECRHSVRSLKRILEEIVTGSRIAISIYHSRISLRFRDRIFINFWIRNQGASVSADS